MGKSMETVSADRNVCVGWLDHDKCDGLQNRNRRLQRYYGFDKHILNGISQSGIYSRGVCQIPDGAALHQLHIQCGAGSLRKDPAVGVLLDALGKAVGNHLAEGIEAVRDGGNAEQTHPGGIVIGQKADLLRNPPSQGQDGGIGEEALLGHGKNGSRPILQQAFGDFRFVGIAAQNLQRICGQAALGQRLGKIPGTHVAADAENAAVPPLQQIVDGGKGSAVILRVNTVHIGIEGPLH